MLYCVRYITVQMMLVKTALYGVKCSMKHNHTGMAELFRSFDSVKTHMGDVVINKGRSQGGCWTISFPPSHSFLTATHIKWHTKGF